MNTSASEKQSLSSDCRNTDNSLRWQWILVASSLVAILAHLILLLPDTRTIADINIADIPLLIIIALGGIPLILQFVKKVVQRDVGADLLAILALACSVWLSEYLAGVLIVLMLASGQALESYAVRKASSVLTALADRMPSVAQRKVGDAIETVPLSSIAPGDIIMVYPHETVVVDGVVLEGNGSMDESYLTGEPFQVSKAPGSNVISGAVNGESAMTIRAEKYPADSRYSAIMSVMQEAEQKRPTVRRIGDRIGAIFAPLALFLAIAVGYYTGDATRFLAILVVATPCPLLIAIPITLISAISMSAKLGIIIKDPTVLESLPICRTAIFDKTGTLTYGQPELTEILSNRLVPDETLLQWVASLELYSKHPLASAILKAANKANLPLIKAEQVTEKPGLGLIGSIAGHELRVTHRKLLFQSEPQIACQLPPTVEGLECVVLLDGEYAATLRFRDTPRTDGKSFISHLNPVHQFDKVMLVSGDRESEVNYLANLLGITEIRASQSPEEKVAIVRAENALAPTFFMGDGINDAPALTSATVGIAFGQHSSVTAEAAGAVIMENTLVKVDELLHISITMRRIVLQSALGGMLLSVIAMIFAAMGMITPVMGALLQEVIDILAIANALRMVWGEIKSDIDHSH